MKTTNSFNNEIIKANNDEINKEKMFLSMKETLHCPLLTIKSRDLLNCFYIDKTKEKENKKDYLESLNINKDSEIIKESPFILLDTNSNKEQTNNNNIFIDNNDNKENKDNEIFLNNFININKALKDNKNINDQILEYNKFCNINGENNFDNIINYENNKINNYLNESNLNTKTLNEKKRKLMKRIKEITKNIRNKINSFKICESTSKVSIETKTDNNIGKYNTSTNINNISNKLFPFEFFDYSFSGITNKSNNINNIKNKNKDNYINSGINNIKIEISQNKKNSKEKKEKYYNNYNRNYLINNRNIKICKPDSDLYTREMNYKKKKESKLEKIRKKEIEEEMSELTYKPRINNISKNMIKNKTPIYKRIKEIELEKYSKIEKIKENIDKNKEIVNNKKKYDEEEFKKWLISNENWNVKKLIKLNNIKREIKKEELNNDDLVFHPKINKNSEKIFKNNNSLSSIPVSDRLCYNKEINYDYHQKLSFIPEINKYYPISEKYYEFMEKDQFQIYNKNLKKINKIKY